MAFTSRWTVFEASSLRSNPLNARQLLEQEKINRGEILAANGTVLARSLPGREGTYSRTYPTGSLFAHPLGYYFTNLGATGLERYRNDVLEGQTQSNLQTILNQLQGIKPDGDKVITSLDPTAQRVAQQALGEHHGAVVALDPAHGGGPGDGLQPLLRTQHPALPRRAGPGAPATATGALVNRAVQDGYAPGSTFKVVTATAAIDTGRYTPESTVSGRDGVLISGIPLSNDQHENFGEITLTEALVHSVNTVYAQVAVSLGKRVLGRYMRRFGFNREPELDYPATEMSVSGEYSHGRAIPPTSPQVDVGRMGIGQDKLEVTALQMAQVAAAVANGGRLMVPHLTSRIVDSEGRTVQTIDPRLQSVVMKRSTATLRGGDDAEGRGRRNRHLGADPGRRRGRQDRYGRDPDRQRDQQRLVHRLRARRRTPAWRSR